MKTLKITLALLASISILSCSSDNEETTEDLTGETGELTLKFDHGVNGDSFAFNTEYSKSGEETYTIENLKYIISNITLTKNDGTTFEYPTEDNVFIIDQSDANNAGEVWLTLTGIDAADYTDISFGVGIDQERFALGAEGQGDFLATAEEEGMFWVWASGYKFIRIDGTFGPTATETDSNALNIHMGSLGASLDNYRTVDLSLPNTIFVRENETSEIHIEADIAMVFDGATSVMFAEGYDQVHTEEVETGIIADNISGMFSVHHVHNQ